jgi:hypothetical protein
MITNNIMLSNTTLISFLYHEHRNKNNIELYMAIRKEFNLFAFLGEVFIL